MARFYGWTDREIESMEAYKFMSYLNCIQSLESREVLNNISAIQYPHLKTSKMRDHIRKITFLAKKVIRPDNKQIASFSNVMDRIKVNRNG